MTCADFRGLFIGKHFPASARHAKAREFLELRQDMGLPRVVCEYEDVFPDELPGLPSQKDVDFVIEMHPGTSPFL